MTTKGFSVVKNGEAGAALAEYAVTAAILIGVLVASIAVLNVSIVRRANESIGTVSNGRSAQQMAPCPETGGILSQDSGECL